MKKASGSGSDIYLVIVFNIGVVTSVRVRVRSGEIQGSDSVILFKIRVVTSVRLRVQYQAQDYGGGFLFNIRVVTSVRPRVRYLVQD